ncbi:MAG: sodium:solute symporter family protein [Gammaproteobacteria bacterium]|nr:sodium:solute symporter family protein [Gammaproteobacteria bacterium]MCP5199441.1 sodium:solute symporter family protein [Gammaproteobacteria bacterium]
MTDLVPLGVGAWAFIGLYLVSLIGIGWWAHRASEADTLQDFYLAGNGFGFVVLFFTLFATQYSGNTFFAFTGATYRIGYAWILSLHFMTAVVIAYLTFAPALHRLARERRYLTPADFIADRYGNRLLTLLVTTIMLVVLCNFLLAQLMAMGRAMQGLARDPGGTAYTAGVIVLALIMVIYGTLGGLRAVAWTDALQGGILAVGFLVLAALLFDHFGSLGEATRRIMAADLAAGTRKALVPDAARCREWLSYILTVGFGICLYPQAIQRIYAARSARVLRRSLAVMAFMPLPTMLISLVAGIMALAYLPGLEGAAADQVFGRVLRELQTHSTLGYGLVVVTMAAVLAAMMSTADSALLSISSMLTKDICAAHLMRDASEAQLTRVGKICSWTLIAILIALAVALREAASLVELMDRKLDLLIQLVPAFILGLRWRGLRGGAVAAGLVAGVALALTLAFADLPFTSRGKVWGFHPGLVALLPNLLIAVAGSLWWPPARPTGVARR